MFFIIIFFFQKETCSSHPLFLPLPPKKNSDPCMKKVSECNPCLHLSIRTCLVVGILVVETCCSYRICLLPRCRSTHNNSNSRSTCNTRNQTCSCHNNNNNINYNNNNNSPCYSLSQHRFSIRPWRLRPGHLLLRRRQQQHHQQQQQQHLVRCHH